ncbi:MAG: sugar ABC transporter permease [Azospirillaceae bacterium]
MAVSIAQDLHPASGEEDWGYRSVDYAPQRPHAAPRRRFYFYLMAPAIIVLACITIYPFLWLIWMSLHNVRLGPAPDIFVGLDNYIRLFNDQRYIEGWILLIKYSAMCLSFEIVIGVLLAVIINNSKYEKILVTLFLMPMMVSPVVAGLLFFYLYNGTFGWYHWLFQSLGFLEGASILGSPKTAMLGIVLVDVWQWTPLITLITLAGLKRVPQDQLEASMVDGSGPMQNFFAVTLPNLYPSLLIAIMLRFMDNFRFIDAILALTGGGPGNATRILPVYLFDVSFRFFDLGRGGAVAFTLLLVTIILGLILVKILEDPSRKRAANGGGAE